MSLNEILTAALNPVAPVEADAYEGRRATYLAFNYDTIPANYGDDEPVCELALVQVHLYAPAGKDTRKLRRAVKSALALAGLTWPSCTNASDKEGQHYVFECEYIAAVGAVEWEN